MILESYDKYEYDVLTHATLSKEELLRKLNRLGQEGWQIAMPLNAFPSAIILQRVIHTSKTN